MVFQEAERYYALAQKSDRVAIMAAPDTGFAEHPTSQPQRRISRFRPAELVAQGFNDIVTSYTAMVLCQELSAADYGQWTTDGRPRAQVRL